MKAIIVAGITTIRSELDALLSKYNNENSHGLEEQAIDYLAERLTTPLQIEQHLTMALMEGFTTGTKPITVEIIEATLSKRIDDIEPRLIRHGYSDKVLVEQFNYKLAEVRRFFKGELDANRAKDITQDLREAGLPI